MNPLSASGSLLMWSASSSSLTDLVMVTCPSNRCSSSWSAISSVILRLRLSFIAPRIFKNTMKRQSAWNSSSHSSVCSSMRSASSTLSFSFGSAVAYFSASMT
eukprot:TRINITY_DN55829_c0_g1_i1.p2 TRINITY_DN55829_c0_g1~~TRINITY_DN55829_c0_g1_i1.p2  ORF type:complete len:103 (-),score=12.12 TRINITY_DN55829_c0_g1_i1:482-790(-)